VCVQVVQYSYRVFSVATDWLAFLLDYECCSVFSVRRGGSVSEQSVYCSYIFSMPT
jgi:hypothetical protein